ncbi:MAG: DnaJ domain-containing protein [Hyphomicrobiaceae bacterium]
MPYFLAGLVIIVAIMFALRWFAQANPQALARKMRTFGGVFCMLIGALLLVRGLGVIGLPLSAFGLYLFLGQGRNARLSRGQQGTGKISRVATDYVEMELDHDTGQMKGRVRKGQFFGKELADLAPVDIAKLWQECRYVDPQSAELLAAYLDNTYANWREDMARATEQGEAYEPGDGAKASAPPPDTDTTMSLEEAYDVLGLDRTATADDVRRAHRDLMRKIHPDHGGSTYLASKINAAKEMLLARLLN